MVDCRELDFISKFQPFTLQPAIPCDLADTFMGFTFRRSFYLDRIIHPHISSE